MGKWVADFFSDEEEPEEETEETRKAKIEPEKKAIPPEEIREGGKSLKWLAIGLVIALIVAGAFYYFNYFREQEGQPRTGIYYAIAAIAIIAFLVLLVIIYRKQEKEVTQQSEPVDVTKFFEHESDKKANDEGKAQKKKPKRKPVE